ncbi:aromatic-ring-hydroxylating dioxygenase subunit beta (plasmid) [Sphingopyxis indica]|nr:aromatic-ring-hydroxylating dioxygenase subunit beta [Sphingopyxis indica]
MAAIELRMQILALLDHYVDAIDNDDLEAWPDFFVDDCLYEIIPKENVDFDLPAPLIRCENKRMLRDRVISLRNANIYPPTTYRHIISGLRIVTEDADGVAFTANYAVFSTNVDGETRIYQTGRYIDRVKKIGDAWKFVEKRAVFDTSRVQTLLALPI